MGVDMFLGFMYAAVIITTVGCLYYTLIYFIRQRSSTDKYKAWEPIDNSDLNELLYKTIKSK